MKEALSKLERILVYVGNACFVLFFAMTTIQVTARAVGFNSAYTEEIANYAFIWLAFVGSSICIRSDEHFRFTAFTERLSEKGKLINKLVVQLILLVFNCIVAYFGVMLFLKFRTWKFSSLPSVSLGWAWLCIPIYGFTAVLYNLEQIYSLLKFGVPTKGEISQDSA